VVSGAAQGIWTVPNARGVPVARAWSDLPEIHSLLAASCR